MAVMDGALIIRVSSVVGVTMQPILGDHMQSVWLWVAVMTVANPAPFVIPPAAFTKGTDVFLCLVPYAITYIRNRAGNQPDL